jgi:hypothetical protein
MVEGEEHKLEELQDDTGALNVLFKGVMPNTPTSTVGAWNTEIQVSLVMVSRQETCGAQVTDGEVDVLACAGGMDCLGERPVGGLGMSLEVRTSRSRRCSR